MTARVHPAILTGNGPCTGCDHGQWHHRGGAHTCRQCPCRTYADPTAEPTPQPTPQPTTSTQLAQAHARITDLEAALTAALRHPPARPRDWAHLADQRDQAQQLADQLAAQVEHQREEIALLRAQLAHYRTATDPTEETR